MYMFDVILVDIGQYVTSHVVYVCYCDAVDIAIDVLFIVLFVFVRFCMHVFRRKHGRPSTGKLGGGYPGLRLMIHLGLEFHTSVDIPKKIFAHIFCTWKD